jgi:hypothetical protein
MLHKEDLVALPFSVLRKWINYHALSPSQHEIRFGALDVINLMRKDRRVTFADAARTTGIDPRQVKLYAGSALEKVHNRYQARDFDRLRRDLYLYDWNGKLVVSTHSSKAASAIGRYHYAVRAFVQYGDETRLHEFDGRSITVGGQQYEFFTDRRRLRQLARAGELNITEIYASGGPV